MVSEFGEVHPLGCLMACGSTMTSSLCFHVYCNKLVAKFKRAMKTHDVEISKWHRITDGLYFVVQFEDYMTLNDAEDFLPEAKWVMIEG